MSSLSAWEVAFRHVGCKVEDAGICRSVLTLVQTAVCNQLWCRPQLVADPGVDRS